MTRKFRFYEKHGVEEYYIYDPETGCLAGLAHAAMAAGRDRRDEGHVSPGSRIRFEPGEGPDSLRIIGPDGQPFLTHQRD